MMQSLVQRQYGVTSCLSWKRSISSQLFPRLVISSTTPAQPALANTVNCLDLEKVEHQYLLAGYGNGGIAIINRNVCENTNLLPIIASVDSSHSATHKYSVDALQWYPHDTGMFLSLSADQTVKIWDTNEMQVADQFKFKSDVLSFHVNERGKKSLVAVTSKDKNVYLCDMKSGSQTHILRGHKNPVFVAKWSPRKESLLVSGSSDGCINVWDVRKAKSLLMTLTSQSAGSVAHNGVVNGLCFTLDGLKLLSYGHDDALRLWDMWKGDEITEVNYGSTKNETKRTVQIDVTSCLSSDLVFIPTECNVEVFEINTGLHVKTLSGHFKNVNCCCYSNVHQELFTGSADYKILLWDHYRNNSYQANMIKQYYQDAWSGEEE